MSKIVTRRELRRTLGTRMNRRRGTKSKVIPGPAKQLRGAAPKYRNFRRQKERPRTMLAKLVKEQLAKGKSVV